MKIQRPNIKINKTWLMLVAAIVLALLTVWLTLQYLTQKERSIEAEIEARSQLNRGQTIAVVVPTRPLPAGALLIESFVASRNVPVDFVHEDVITVEQFERYKGQALLRTVQKGKPLRITDVHEVFADFSGTLPAGKRAITINVDEINSVAHMVEPGNLVDLMLVLSSSGDGAAGSTSQAVVPFLDQVKVLATGQKVRPDDPDMQAGDDRRRGTYSTITLEVTPAQGARLTLAGELGKLRAVLRNGTDKQSVTFDSVNANNLMEDILERERKAATGRPRSAGKYVEYFIGGKAGSDAVAPVINMPAMPGLSSGGMPAQTSASSADALSNTSVPQSLTDLVKMSYSANAAPAASSK